VLPANTSKVAVVSDKSNSCVGKVLHGRPFGTSYGRRMGIDDYREPLTPFGGWIADPRLGQQSGSVTRKSLRLTK
jgi:hypothetical protein